MVSFLEQESFLTPLPDAAKGQSQSQSISGRWAGDI
jgi:hypothetical protein